MNSNKKNSNKKNSNNRTVEVDFDKLIGKVPIALTFLPVLKLLAQKQETMTYKELGQLFGIHQRAIPSYLRILDIYCATHRLPHLNHLVVHQRTQISGGKNNLDGPITFHEQLKEQEEIFDHNWSDDRLPKESTVYKDVLTASVV
jgi:hypothetical protein